MQDITNSAGVTPLCHSVTSPPQGGRLAAAAAALSTFPRSTPVPFVFVGQRNIRDRPISPLEGEMSRSDRGGYVSPISIELTGKQDATPCSTNFNIRITPSFPLIASIHLSRAASTSRCGRRYAC